jgi:hypothetical protein
VDQLRPALKSILRGGRLLAAVALTGCSVGDGAASQRRPDLTERASATFASHNAALAPGRSPADEKLAQFRASLVAPVRLSGGATSRDALIRRFVRAVERRDTSAIRAMVLDRSEFAYLYYPSSPYTRPPTVQEAPLAWFLLVQNSQKGVTRVFNRYGGQRVEYVGHRCDPEPTREGANLFWHGCVVDLKTSLTGVVARKLFGSIIERDGQLKFFSYTNDY